MASDTCCNKSQNQVHHLQIGLSVVSALLGALLIAILWNRFCRRLKSSESRHQHGRNCSYVDQNHVTPFIRVHDMHQPGVYVPNHLQPASINDGRNCNRRNRDTSTDNIDDVHEPRSNVRQRLQMQQISRHVNNESMERSNSSLNVVGRKCTAIGKSLPCGSDVNEETNVMLPRPFKEDLFVHPQLNEICERSKTIQADGKLIVFVSRKVSDKGDHLILDNMGISLHVPPGAIQNGDEQLISLVLNWDLSDNPTMTEEESLVSPVVFVGPHGLQFQKPCILSFKHCAYDSRHIQVMRSETDLTAFKDWRLLCDQQDDSGKCILTQDECQLTINSFTLFTCVQRPSDGLRIGKWLQIAAFSNPLKSHINHHQVRIYFLNKTPCALQWAKHNEAEFGGKLICPEKAFLFFGNTQDMRVILKYLSETWEVVDNDDEERIQYVQIWHGQCPHVSMCFRQKKSSKWSRELNFQMFVYQETLDNEGEKIVVHATEEVCSNGLSRSHPCDKHPNECGATIININAGTHSVNVEQIKEDTNNTSEHLTINVQPDQQPICDVLELEEIQKSRVKYIPHTLATQLKARLDPPCALGKNWKRLAEELHMDGCIDFIESKNCSPTELLLKVVEYKNISLEKLAQILQNIDRLDAASLVNNYIDDTDNRSTANQFHSLTGSRVYQHPIGNQPYPECTDHEGKQLNVENSCKTKQDDISYRHRRDYRNRVWGNEVDNYGEESAYNQGLSTNYYS